MAQTNFLEHQIGKFGAVTVLDVLLRDPETGDNLLFLDTLKVSSIAMEGSTKEIRGGIGAPTLLEYDYGRTVTFEMQDALASVASLATMWGGKYGIASGAKTTAVYTGVTGTEGALNIPTEMGATSTNAKAYGIVAGDEITITGDEGALKAGTESGVAVMVFIEGTVDSAATRLTIDSISLPPTVELIGRTQFIETTSGKPQEYELRIPRLKVNIGGGLSMEAEGDAAVFDFSGKALADPITREFFTLTKTGRGFTK